MHLIKIIITGGALLLFIIDCVRIAKREPLRQEWVSFLYFIYSFIILWHIIKPGHFLSGKTIIVFLSACGMTLMHAVFTVFNYWITSVRWERMVIFFIIAWTGIATLFIVNLYLIWFLM